MHILFLSNFYPPHDYGGYEQWCHEVATGLYGRGHEVSVLTSRYRRRQSNGCTQRVMAEVSIPVQRTLHLETDLHYYNPFDFLRRPWYEWTNAQTLRQAIAHGKPDVMMVWGMWNLSHTLPYRAEEWLAGRVTYFVSNYWPTDVNPHTAYWQLPANRTSGESIKRPLRTLALAQLRYAQYPPPLRFDHALCCSHYVRNALVAAGKLPASAGVLYGGTNPAPFLAKARKMRLDPATEKQPLRLLYFGRLDPEKGVHTAVEALCSLKRRAQPVAITLTIIGSGHPAYEAQLREAVHGQGLETQVEFVAKIPREEIPAWLGRFDVYLFTSVWPEPMARSVMEAMAAGLVVIGTEVGGQAEMFCHNHNALTFQPGDAEALADHIARLAQDPALRTRLACAGQKLVLERFTLERMVNEIEQYLSDVVEKAPPLKA